MSLSKPFYQNNGHIYLRLMLHPIVSVSFHIVTENYHQLWVLSSMTTRVLPLPAVLTSTWDIPARPRVDTWQLTGQNVITNENHSEINLVIIFTRGQFWPSGIVVACVCVCVCVCVCLSVCLCVNHLLVRTITRDLFKLGSPNLDQRCKRPWLRSLLFWGAIDLDLQGQI